MSGECWNPGFAAKIGFLWSPTRLSELHSQCHLFWWTWTTLLGDPQNSIFAAKSGFQGSLDYGLLKFGFVSLCVGQRNLLSLFRVDLLLMVNPAFSIPQGARIDSAFFLNIISWTNGFCGGQGNCEVLWFYVCIHQENGTKKKAASFSASVCVRFTCSSVPKFWFQNVCRGATLLQTQVPSVCAIILASASTASSKLFPYLFETNVIPTLRSFQAFWNLNFVLSIFGFLVAFHFPRK